MEEKNTGSVEIQETPTPEVELAEAPAQEVAPAQKPKVSLTTKLRANTETLLVLFVGIYGLFFTLFIMKGQGGSRVMNTSVFPRLIYILMLVAGVMMLLSKNKYKPPSKEYDVSILFLICYIGGLAVYFLLGVRYLGFVVSTAIFMFLQVSVLAPNFKKDLKGILITTAIGTVLLWAIYVKVIGIMLPNAILF